MQNGQLTETLCKLSAGVLLTLLPAYGLQAYDGAIDDPHVIDANDKTMDGGTAITPFYYLAIASVDFGSYELHVGVSHPNNFLTVTGVSTTVKDYRGYIGSDNGSTGTVTVTSGSTWIDSGDL